MTRRRAQFLVLTALNVVGLAPGAAAAPLGSPFKMTCRDITMVSGGDQFAFNCVPATGATVTVAVAYARDLTGVYPAPASAMSIGAADHARQAMVAGVVETFVVLKAVNPSVPITVDISGYSSRLPVANGALRVDLATLRR